MAYPTAATAFAAASAASAQRTNMLSLHTDEIYMPVFREAVFNACPFLKAIALNAFGRTQAYKGQKVDPMYGNVAGSKRETSGKAMKFTDYGTQVSGPIFTAAPTGTVVGRMGNINPQYNDTGSNWAYAYRRFVWPIYIPEEERKANAGKQKLLDLKETQMKLAQGAANRDLTYAILGHTSAPTNSPTGLPDLVAVTQTATIGAIASTNSYWQNKFRACTSVGGGGEVDRPLVLLRALQSLDLDVATLSGASTSVLYVATRGAYQYLSRAHYGDTTAQGLRNEKYVAGEIPHILGPNGAPVTYDSYVTTPTGASATTTECIYRLDLESWFLAICRDEFFLVEGWEQPRAHDKQRYDQLNIWLRFADIVSNRRVQAVLYNIPNNTDAD